MRHPLQKFTDFTHTLLPHETAYLLRVQQFKDGERLAILERVHRNAQRTEGFTPYDASIDKRKYHHFANWVKTRLAEVDVDERMSWMLRLENRIMTDTVRAEEERELLRAIRRYQHPAFYFTRFYELVDHYCHFLLVRMRYNDHQVADRFLKQYAQDYQKAKQTNERIHIATVDIVGQYQGDECSAQRWQSWLTDVFYEETLEGHLRYLALVRLVFIAHNQRAYEPLREQFDYLDQQFTQGRYYSKRLLLNYYSNRLMLHSNFGEYDRALEYGYLSVRAKTHDYLLYVNNLCAVLLRLHHYPEALQLMQQAAPEAKNTKNMHNRVGYVAFYMEALNKNGFYLNAASYGESFLCAYDKEILQYRWHLFFSMYMEALLHTGRCELLLRVAKRYKLLRLDKDYQSNASYLPVVPLYLHTARYLEGQISVPAFIKAMAPYMQSATSRFIKQEHLKQVLATIALLAPELLTRLKQTHLQKIPTLPQ